MRPYETAFLIAPNLPEEDNEKLIDQMAEIVSKKKGKMVNIDKWGKRRLAYPIKKYEEAYYVFFLYEGEPAVLTELERRFKQTEPILRYLTVKTEMKELVKKKERAAPRRKKKETSAKEEPPPIESTFEEATSEESFSEETTSDERPPEGTTPPVGETHEEQPAEEETKEEV